MDSGRVEDAFADEGDSVVGHFYGGGEEGWFEAGQDEGLHPGGVAGLFEAELDEAAAVGAAGDVEQPHQGGDGGDRVLHVVDLFGEDAVDLQEVALESMNSAGGGGFGGGDGEVEIDVGVHAEQEVLGDGAVGTGRPVEGQGPGTADGGAGLPGVIGGEVAVGEYDVEALHTGGVVEAASGDAFFDGAGDAAVEGGEVAEAGGVGAGGGDDGGELVNHSVDRVGVRHCFALYVFAGGVACGGPAVTQ